MKILVLNAGSSSLKFTLFRMYTERILASGTVERIGMKNPNLCYEKTGQGEIEEEVQVADYEDALRLICNKLVDPGDGVLDSLDEVEAVGHRVVHGAEKFTDSVIIDSEVKSAINLCSSLAPLHNPPNLGGIEACERVFENIPNVAVFDTAFHQTMPDKAYMYALPHKLYDEHGIRKYGFHGTSHKFISYSAAEYLNRPLDSLKLITCHLGNGASISAVENGQVIDTSMGMTPLMGLMMGTRCGEIDPGVLIYLSKKGMTADEIDNILNKKSGLRGVGQIGSGDMRDIIQAANEGNENARCAFEMYIHRLIHYIGAYYLQLGGADAIIFTGGVGENSIPTRKAVIEKLHTIGCYPDPAKEESRGETALLSTPDSTIQALVIPTNEELMIGRDTLRLVQQQQNL